MKKFSVLFDGVVSTTKEAVKKIAHNKHTLSLVDQPRHDDLYIVSFPKSGATWMDFLMANIHTTMSGDKRSINFFNIHTIIPDVHYCRQVGVANLAFPGFRVIKSHAEFNRYYKNVVYLIRDPRDAMVSYYKFLVGLGQFSGTVSDLIRSPRYGIDAWVNHVDSWYFKSEASLRITIVRYEDLKNDSYSALKHLYNTLGFEISDEVLNLAIQKSSFDNMKILEKAWNYGGRPVAENFKFMQKGVSGSWNEILSENDHAYICKASEKILLEFGYAK